jgi:diacylglycerol kinase (ATP)
VLKSIVFIVNPVAGSAKVGPIIADLARRFGRGGARVQVLKTARAGHAQTLARNLTTDVDLLVAVGGDGTVREVAEGRIEHPLPIAIVPAGTENLVARHLAMRASAECLWRCITCGSVRPFDVGVVNGRHFLIVSGAGFDAEIVQRLTRTRRGHITRTDYFWPMWRTFWQYRFPPVSVTADGQTLFEGQGLVFVGNISHYGMGLRILRDARDHDGLLDVCIYPCRWQGRLLVHSFFTAIKRHVERPDVIYRRARRVTIQSPVPLALEADGDCAGALPAELTVLPARARFCVPPGYPTGG